MPVKDALNVLSEIPRLDAVVGLYGLVEIGIHGLREPLSSVSTEEIPDNLLVAIRVPSPPYAVKLIKVIPLLLD